MKWTTLRGIVCALAALWALGAAHAQTCPQRLRIAFPDTPAEPFLRGQGEAFEATPGLLVDWVQAALRRMGCLERAELLRLPARRVRSMIESGQLDLVAGVGEGGPLGALLALPPPTGPRGEFDLSLGQVDYALYSRRGLVARQEPGQAAPALPLQARVGVMAGSRAETLARERGWPVEPAPSHESALQKLLAGRTPLLLVHSYYLDQRLRQDGAQASQIERFGPVVERRRLHVGAQPALASDAKEFVQQLWRELCRQSAASRADGACRLPP